MQVTKNKKAILTQPIYVILQKTGNGHGINKVYIEKTNNLIL